MSVSEQAVVDAIPHVLSYIVPGYILFSMIAMTLSVQFHVVSQVILSILLSYGTIHIVDMICLTYGQTLGFWTFSFYCVVFDAACGLFVMLTSHRKHQLVQIVSNHKPYCKDIASKERYTRSQTEASNIMLPKMDATKK